MKDYHINVFWSDEDGCYVADIPDLARCSAFGPTPQEAVAEVMEAKQAWRTPPARPANQFRARVTDP